MSGKVRLLVFDWDGTLMDSESQIVASMQAAIRDLTVPVPDAGRIREIIGLGLPEAIEALLPGHSPDFHQRLVARYRHHWLAPGNRCELFPGAARTLNTLHERGYHLAVATGKGRRGLDKALQETGLAGLFRATRCADETCSKPDPRMLHEIMQAVGAAPAETIMVGDTEYDMQMARNAGAAAVAVRYGVHHCDRLLSYAPLTCLDRITDLVPWLAGPGDRVAGPVPGGRAVRSEPS